MKRLFTLFLVFLFPIIFFTSISAKENVQVQEVSSFELFWPVSAGKTLGDSLYGLKTFKEKIRGMLIFGKVQKVDYSLFLATKRVVEAEKLLGEGKIEPAKKTLAKMMEALEAATINISIPQELKGKGDVDEINKKLGNLETFLPILSSKYEVAKPELEALLQEVKSINQKI